MPVPAAIALAAVAVLMVKHCLVDFFLQSPYQYRNKGTYLHPGGLLHAGLHGLGSLPVLLLLPVPLVTAAVVIGAEMLIHYHVDFAKEQITRARNLTPVMTPYWNALGVDQLVHGLTYVAMVYALAAGW